MWAIAPCDVFYRIIYFILQQIANREPRGF